MTTLLRVQANRLNALKSTGPRSIQGKAASSLNSIRHGLRTWKPVLLPGESMAEWKKFARAVLEDLQPHGPVETMWAGRAALLMWRLQRSADARKTLTDQQWREAQVLAPESAWWQHRRNRDKAFPSSLEGIRQAMAKSTREQALLKRVAALPAALSAASAPEAQRPADPVTAADLIEWAAEHLGADAELETMHQNNNFPGIGPLLADPDPERYEWSLGIVREALTEVAGWNHETFHGLLATLIPAMKQAHRAMRAGLRRAEREMRRFRLCSAARSPETFKNFDRYEAMLERTVARALSQLKVLQSQRSGESSPSREQPPQNVVHVGFAALEMQEKQP
jgi:hypothetical protein